MRDRDGEAGSSLVKAGILTVLVFIAGLSAGYMLDVQRTDYLADELRSAQLESDRFLVGQQYLQGSDDRCDAMEPYIQDLAAKTQELGEDLESLSGAGIFRDQDYKHLKHQYYIYQLRTWMTLEEYRTRCDESLVTVLYFFEDNSASQQQGSVLTEVRRQHQGDMFVFSFDIDADDTPVVDMIQQDFNVSSGPTIIVNGADRHTGFVSLGELRSIVRGYLPSEQEQNRTAASNGTAE